MQYIAGLRVQHSDSFVEKTVSIHRTDTFKEES